MYHDIDKKAITSMYMSKSALIAYYRLLDEHKYLMFSLWCSFLPWQMKVQAEELILNTIPSLWYSLSLRHVFASIHGSTGDYFLSPGPGCRELLMFSH